MARVDGNLKHGLVGLKCAALELVLRLIANESIPRRVRRRSDALWRERSAKVSACDTCRQARQEYM